MASTVGERVGRAITAHVVASYPAGLVACLVGLMFCPAVAFAPVVWPVVIVGAAVNWSALGNTLRLLVLASAAIYGLSFAGFLYWSSRPDPRPPVVAPGLCPTCGYDLRASAARCPECGRSLDPPV